MKNHNIRCIEIGVIEDIVTVIAGRTITLDVLKFIAIVVLLIKHWEKNHNIRCIEIGFIDSVIENIGKKNHNIRCIEIFIF